MVAILVWPASRNAFVDLARAFLSRKIWPIVALLGLWSLGLVIAGRQVSIWTGDLVADTGFWFFTTAVVLLFNFNKASEDPDFFKTTAKETFGLTLLLGSLSDLYVLSAPVEFIGQGVLAVLACLSVVAAHQSDSADVRRFADGCLSLVGLTILLLALVALTTGWSNEAAPDLARRLFLPAWMTLGVLPYIYVVALYAAYEMAFKWVDFRNAYGFRARFRAKAALVVRLHGRVTLVDKVNLYWAKRAVEAGTFGAALEVVDEFKADVAQRAAKRHEVADRVAGPPP